MQMMECFNRYDAQRVVANLGENPVAQLRERLHQNARDPVGRNQRKRDRDRNILRPPL